MARFDPTQDPRPCARALELIACEVAGALRSADSSGLALHLARCGECAASRRRLRRLVRAIRDVRNETPPLLAPGWSKRPAQLRV